MPPDVRVLGRVVEEVGKYLDQADRIGVDEDGLAGPSHLQGLALFRQEGSAHLDRAAQNLGAVAGLFSQLDLALAHARDIEQIVEQTLHVLDLLGDDGAAVFGLFRLLISQQAKDLDRAEDGRQRIPQLVRQHGQELVLARVDLAHALLDLRALGDVLAGAQQADGSPRCVAFDVDPGVDHALGGVRTNDAVLVLEAFALLDTRGCHRLRGCAIVGVNRGQEGRVVEDGRPRVVAEDAVVLL